MALIFYNPQKNVMLGLSVFNWLNKSKLPLKYGYLLQLLRDNKASIFCDNYGSSFPFSFFTPLNLIVKYVEIYLWLIVNKINIFHVKVIFNKKKLSSKDYLFFFGYLFLQKHPLHLDSVMDLNGHKLIHFSHYFFRTKELNGNVSNCSDVTLVAENDLYNNSRYFNRFFPEWKSPVYVLPFAVTNRFKNISPFDTRENKCVAVGSFVTYERADYNYCMFDYQDSDTIQPIRKEIYLSKNKYINQIENKIGYINEFQNLKSGSNSSILNKIVDFQNFYLKKIKKNWGKSSYFKTDVVKLYNRYKMVFSSDDAGDLPSIAFFEALYCGCACFAIPGEKFSDLGLIENFHYLGFDGTLKSLIERIKYYQKHEDELLKIAINGESFSKQRFTSSRISKQFIDDWGGS